MLSAHGGKGLPKIVKLWLTQWFGRKSDEPCALIVSFNEDSRDSASAVQIVSSLQAEAKARDVAVFTHFSRTSTREDDQTVQTNLRPAHSHATRLDDNWRRPEFELHWGINE